MNAIWHKSSYSTGNGACVEIALVEGVVAVRDSKDPGRPGLAFSPREWRAFLATAGDGRPRRR
ncbi:hypothetical protein M2164_001469 [Streptomyces sp. SAI-208]|jgi:hypothetical protein|uniref:DUF397 domain-containing protein n=1 Tax=unclassified Streptomyces TaxID=2593676 RepID=UPI002476C63F|nr:MULTISPECIES: DUF397 domain-containing protein [unclassified Streptomyces]MDH6514988.1 hypothetical protein [Streptomyces sp. SAI-090]MDH6547203.1 hypothetical protein [Streptomyces sp. SAI-041]MDH6566283.1 hypothetical protein [Streptomyces sp. SAI-117]MDH6588777.1 hypothetical protein [Streptomyces sp. SAI-133]MDH6605834.1 hypothetical protein [Streptomyces sp. SAI-208]